MSSAKIRGDMKSGYDVVIPAGGTIDAAYAQAIGSPNRALAPIGLSRRPVLQGVIDILQASGAFRRIIVAAPPAVQEAVTGVDIWLPAGESGARNILAGLAEANPDRPALICPCDLPLLTPGSVIDFLERCTADAEIAVGLIRAGDYNEMFRDAPPSQFVALAEVGPVTLGGLFLVHPRMIIRQAVLLESLFGSRKSQYRMARLLGPRLLWGWATGRLTLSLLSSRAEELLNGPVQTVADVSPVLAYDIDTLDDYTYANLHIRSRPAAAAQTLYE